jgi:hypothetical protein
MPVQIGFEPGKRTEISSSFADSLPLASSLVSVMTERPQQVRFVKQKCQNGCVAVTIRSKERICYRQRDTTHSGP